MVLPAPASAMGDINSKVIIVNCEADSNCGNMAAFAAGVVPPAAAYLAGICPAIGATVGGVGGAVGANTIVGTH